MKALLQLTERDKKLFAEIHKYGFFKTSQLVERVFGGTNSSTTLRRLRALENEGYIARIPGLDGGELAWFVTDKGSCLVSSKPPKKNFSPATMNHDLKLLELRLAFERENLSGAWKPEFEIRREMAQAHGTHSMNKLAIPDGLVAMRYKDQFRPVAIELELNYKNRDRYLSTFRRYLETRYILAVWYLVDSPGLGKSLDKVWTEIGKGTGSISFLWSIADEVLNDPRNAIVRSGDFQKTVGQIFGPANLPNPIEAQTTAQPVSTQASSSSTRPEE